MSHRAGCFVCGKPLVYSQQVQTLPCHFCGRMFETNASCEDGHYVCDDCHAKQAIEEITKAALLATGDNPMDIAYDMMKSPYVNMHGPEHHYLVPAALLAAYHNAGGSGDLAQQLEMARQRSAQVPGGVCGMWGACGAGLGAGIFVSVVTGANPLSVDSWSLANQLTARCLQTIAEHGGPRCCKRDSWLALREAAQFANEKLGTTMGTDILFVCRFFPMNPQCIKERCPFYPKPKA